MGRLGLGTCALSTLVVLVGACRFDPSGLAFDGDGDGAVPGPDPVDAGPPGAVDAATPPGPPDAMLPPGLPDATVPAPCPVECTFCHGDGTCQIDCGAGECNGGVTCPPGRPCVVSCMGTGACELGAVDCTLATSCAITCSGTDTCDSGVRCGGSSCTVLCDGNAACEDLGVTCNASSCDITCKGWNACKQGVCCAGDDCGSDCSSSGGACCACDGC